VAFSPDGNLCANAGGDESIQVRRASDGALVRTLPGHAGCVTGVAFSPDSAVLASSGGPLEPTIKLWRLSDGAVLRTIDASTNGVTALAFSPDGSILASGGDFSEQTIQLWNVSDGTLRQTLAGHTNGVTTLAFSQDGSLIASGGRRFDNTVKIWAVTNGALLRSWSGHAWNIETVAFSPDGATVASGSRGTNPLAVWRMSDSSRRSFGSGTNPVFTIAFSPDSSVLASAEKNAVNFWNVALGTLVETVNVEMIRPASVAFSPNGNLLLCGREDGTVTMSGNNRGALGQPPLAFTGLNFEAGGATLISASVQPWTHYVIWSSPNLADWSFVTLAMSRTNRLTIADQSTSDVPGRFYRATTPE
jgi:WD40 repeat protein